MEDKLKVTGVLSQGYGIIPKMLMKDSDLTIEAKAIYAYIASYAGNGSTAFPSISLICTDLDIGEKRFHVHKKTLIEKGYIKVEQERGTRGKFNRNVYTINSVLMPMTAQDVVEPTPQNDTTVNESPTGHYRSTDERSTDEPTSVDRGTNNNSINNNSFINNNNKNKQQQQPVPGLDAKKEPKKINFVTSWEQNGFGVIPMITIQKLNDWVADFGGKEEIIVKAIELASDNNARNYAYINAILKRWEDKGVKTIEDIEAIENQREKEMAAKQQGNRKQTSHYGRPAKKEVTPDWATEEYQAEQDGKQDELMSAEDAFAFQMQLLHFRGESALPVIRDSFDQQYGEGTFEKLYANYQKERVAE